VGLILTLRQSLRELCDDYFHGLVSVDLYRQRRRALLDQASFAPELIREADDDPTQRRPNSPVPPGESIAAASLRGAMLRKRNRYFAAGGSLALAALVFWWLSGARLSDSMPAVRAIANTEAPAAATAPEEETSAFVARFIEAKIWTEKTVSDFLFEWDQLTDSERAAVRTSDAFRSMTRNIQSQIPELRAPADSAKPAAMERVRLLARFARELDLDLGPGVGELEKVAPSRSEPTTKDQHGTGPLG
jgi:hypothetical protein